MSESNDVTSDLASVANDTSTSIDVPQSASQPAQPVKRRKRRRLWLVMSVLLVVAILAASGFGAYHYAMEQYKQLTALGMQMCDYLGTHNYDSLYQRFSDSLKGKFSQGEFAHYGSEIDQFEGNVLTCGQAAGNHFTYDLGQRTITVASVVSRDGSGVHNGNVRFRLTDSGWKVDGFEVGFLGVSLDALKLFDNYCTALKKRDDQAIYQMMAPALKTETLQQFLQSVALHREVDGFATACALDGISAKNTDASSTLSLHIQWQQHYGTGTITFGNASGGWAITHIDPSAQGRDLTPVIVSERWCSDIQSQNYTDAFGLLTSEIRQAITVTAYAAQYSGKKNGVKWLNCTVRPSTYSGDSSENSVTLNAGVQLENTRTKKQMSNSASIGLAPDGGTWGIALVFLCGAYAC